MKKLTWHQILFSIFMIFMYSMGTYDFFMMNTHNTNYYVTHGYGQAVVEYFTNYPFLFMIFWIANLVFGWLAPLLLLLNNKYAKTCALISTISDFILLVVTFAFRNRLAVLGLNIAVFDIGILLLTFLFFYYCKKQNKLNININNN